MKDKKTHDCNTERLSKFSMWFFRGAILAILALTYFIWHDYKNDQIKNQRLMSSQAAFQASILETQLRILHHVDRHSTVDAEEFCPECGDHKWAGTSWDELIKLFQHRHMQIKEELRQEEEIDHKRRSKRLGYNLDYIERQNKYEPEFDSTDQ